jgi:hypothetical protein
MPGFFDKMKTGITEKAMEASVRSKEAIESQQVKGKIGDLEGQKRKILQEIGEAVFTMYQSGNFDQEALSAQCQGIMPLEAQIKEREAELEEIHRKAEAAISEGRGAPAPSAAASSAPAPATAGAPGGAFCPNCGTATEGAKFCPNCGSKVA